MPTTETPGPEPQTLAEVSRRSRAGWVALALRGGAGKVITLGALVLLSRLLAPADFGVFAILQFPLGVLSLVADAGLHAALVQREAVSEDDEAAGFTLRLLLAVGLGALTVLAADALGALYQLDTPAVWALRLLALGPIINALGTVPGMRLTRRLRFDRLAWAELGSLLAGQVAAVGLAFAGAGLFSLAGGALASTLAGTLLVNVLAPWRPRLRLPAEAARGLLRYGLPYQAQGLAHLAKDRVIPALGGLLLSGGQVGYLAWAQDLAHWPRLPADYVARVGFPAFARLQADPAGLAGAVNEAVGLVVLVSGGLSAAALALAPALVTPVFGAEWSGALLPLLIFLIQTPLDALAAVLLPVVYALGQAGRGLRLSVAWAALTWGLCLLAVAVWPLLPPALAGAALAAIPTAYGLGTLAAVALLLTQLPHYLRLDKWRSVLRPVLLAAAGGLVLRVLVEVILKMILYLAPEAPVPPLSGGRERAQQLLAALTQRAPLHLLSCASAEEAPQLIELARGLGLAGLTIQPYPADTRGYVNLTPLARRLASELPGLTAVHCQGLDLWPVARALPAPRRVLELHDLPTELQPAPQEVTPDRRHAARLDALRAAGALIVVSEFDRQRLRAWGLRGPIHVIENGVDLDGWATVPPESFGAPTLLFPAALNWPPNVAAARALVEQVWPLVQAAVPDCRVVIAGRQPSADLHAWAANNKPGLTLLPDPPDMRPLLAAATLVVVPMPAASGTRLKILQALAAGRAVVSTPAGAQGLDLTAGRDLSVAALVEPFAAEVVRLLGDATARTALIANGRAAVARYDWPLVLAAVNAVYENERE